MATEAQVRDWIDHPEKYDFNTDDDFARFIVWTEMLYDINSYLDENGVVIVIPHDSPAFVNPVNEQVIAKVNERRSRGRLH